jgi:hypothetical protein
MRIFNFVQSMFDPPPPAPYTAEDDIGISDPNPTPNQLKPPPICSNYETKMDSQESISTILGRASKKSGERKRMGIGSSR